MVWIHPRYTELVGFADGHVLGNPMAGPLTSSLLFWGELDLFFGRKPYALFEKGVPVYQSAS